MTKENNKSTYVNDLRRRAEEKLIKMEAKAPSAKSEMDALRLIQELHIHQIELELQNEEMKQARDDVDEWLALYTELYDFAPVGYFSLDRYGIINRVNLRGASLIGIVRSHLVDRHFSIFLSSDSVYRFNTFLATVFENRTKQVCEVFIKTEAGNQICAQIEAADISMDSEECRIAVIDITERKRMEDELRRANAEQERKSVDLGYQATHDSLTGLPNRHHFEEHLGEIIKRSSGKNSHLMAVLFLDVDKFKQTNDTLGHNVGDLLLIEVADRLQLCLRSEDLLARMGGDEFTVILPRCNSRTIAQSVAARIIESINHPFEIDGHRIESGVSIGIASYPSDGADIAALLNHADEAMYKAKQIGGGAFCWYSGDVEKQSI